MGIFTGLDPEADFFADGSTLLLMNANGDFAWIDPQNEMIWEAVDLTSRETPEPSTFALLGTGILGLGGVARRKFLMHGAICPDVSDAARRYPCWA